MSDMEVSDWESDVALPLTYKRDSLDYQPLVSYGDLPGTSGVIQHQSQGYMYTTFLHCATTTAARNNVAGRNPLYSAGEYGPTQRWGLKS